MIKDKFQNSFNFKFELVSTDQVIKFIDEIDCNKSSSSDIPAKIIKIAKEEIAEPIRNCINSSISTGIFPDKLKIADIVPVFKKEGQTGKTNYRPISRLPLISKIFEKFLYQQIDYFSNKILPPKLCGFRKCFLTQHALFAEKLTKVFRKIWGCRNCNNGSQQSIRFSSS